MKWEPVFDMNKDTAFSVCPFGWGVGHYFREGCRFGESVSTYQLVHLEFAIITKKFHFWHHKYPVWIVLKSAHNLWTVQCFPGKGSDAKSTGETVPAQCLVGLGCRACSRKAENVEAGPANRQPRAYTRSVALCLRSRHGIDIWCKEASHYLSDSVFKTPDTRPAQEIRSFVCCFNA